MVTKNHVNILFYCRELIKVQGFFNSTKKIAKFIAFVNFSCYKIHEMQNFVVGNVMNLIQGLLRV